MVAPAVLFGAATGGMKIGQAVSGFLDQRNQARAVNQQRVQQYRNQLKLREFDYNRGQAIYAQKLGQLDQTYKENQRGYSRAIGDSQAWS